MPEKINKFNAGRFNARQPAFTLIEAIASLAILAFMLTGIMVAYQRTLESVSSQVLRERATAVAQRHIEMLLAHPQEPNSVGLPEIDTLDPFFTWQLNLERIAATSSAARKDLANTTIVATVTVDCELPEAQPFQQVKLVRYFATLKPRPGQTIAVPFTPQKEEALWMIELKEKLGREPTIDEIVKKLFEVDGVPADLAQELELLDLNEPLDEDEIIDFED